MASVNTLSGNLVIKIGPATYDQIQKIKSSPAAVASIIQGTNVAVTLPEAGSIHELSQLIGNGIKKAESRIDEYVDKTCKFHRIRGANSISKGLRLIARETANEVLQAQFNEQLDILKLHVDITAMAVAKATHQKGRKPNTIQIYNHIVRNPEARRKILDVGQLLFSLKTTNIILKTALSGRIST